MANNLFSEELFYSGAAEFDMKKNTNITSTEYRNPSNDIMVLDGLYNQGMGASPMMVYEEASFSPQYHNNDPLVLGSEDPLRELPPDLEDMVNSIFLSDNNMFDTSGVDQIPNIHVDVAAMFPENDSNEDLFGSGSNISTIDPSQMFGAENPISLSVNNNSLSSTRRERKARKAKTNGAAVEESSNSPFMSYDSHYPTLDESGSGIASPSSPYLSDASSVGEDNLHQKQRQRRPRVSYSTLTDEERYKRIRDLNNEASRHYREKQKQSMAKLEEELPALIERNKHLSKKAVGLEDLVSRMRNYSDLFLRQHMPNQSAGNF